MEFALLLGILIVFLLNFQRTLNPVMFPSLKGAPLLCYSNEVIKMRWCQGRAVCYSNQGHHGFTSLYKRKGDVAILIVFLIYITFYFNLIFNL